MTKFYELNDFKIAYQDNGNYSRPWMLLIHGNSHGKEVFKNQMNDSDLSKAFHIIALDLPGHGESLFFQDNDLYNLPNYGKIIKDFINFLRPNSFGCLLGHSLGGHVAIEASALLDNLKGLFIWGTPPFAEAHDFSLAFLNSPVLPYLFQANLSSIEVNDLALACSGPIKNEWENSKKMIMKTDPKAREGLGLSIQKNIFNNEKTIINNLNCPVFVLYGLNDNLINPEYFISTQFEVACPSIKTTALNSSHSPHLEISENFNKLLKELIF